MLMTGYIICYNGWDSCQRGEKIKQKNWGCRPAKMNFVVDMASFAKYVGQALGAVYNFNSATHVSLYKRVMLYLYKSQWFT